MDAAVKYRGASDSERTYDLVKLPRTVRGRDTLKLSEERPVLLEFGLRGPVHSALFVDRGGQLIARTSSEPVAHRRVCVCLCARVIGRGTEEHPFVFAMYLKYVVGRY